MGDKEKLEFLEYEQGVMVERSGEFYDLMRRRRSVRDFSTKAVEMEVIKNCVRTAGAAPSGANCQPWRFCVVSDIDVKKRIRVEAERVEKEFYAKESNVSWVSDLEKLGTNTSKPFLEEAGCLIVVFAELYGVGKDGEKIKHYYVNRSVGLAVGFLIAAVHNAGLGCLTYTPAPMDFVGDILGAGANERPFMVLAVGYPADGCEVPAITKKELDDYADFF